MKRSGQPKPFRTIGTRMRDFGRSMMRHYVPPQDMPPLVEPPPPAWSAAAQTPLVWPEPDAPAGFAAEIPLAPPDIGFDDVPETQDFDVPAQPQRAPRPAPAQQPPQPRPQLPPSVQRKPAPPPAATSVDQRLKNILAMHQEREAERDRFREEKKSAFNAAEIQRQADPDAPQRPRRGRMSVDYVETSALSHGEEAPPAQSVQREAQPHEDSALNEPQPTADDTERLDPSVIQTSLDTMSLQRELSGEIETAEENYTPAGDEDNAQAYFESPPDWSEDSGDEGTPPPIAAPPTPMPPQGSAQRMPNAPSTDDFSEQSEQGAATEYPYETDSGDAEAPPASDTITLSSDRVQRAYTPDEIDEPDFGGAADFEPTYDTYNDAADASDVSYDSGAEFLNPPSATVQREYESQTTPTADFSVDFDQSDAGYGELPTFDMDDGETRPIDVQRAPVLPPPDFADEDAPPAETGYNSLADWVDAHSDAPDTVQRDYESATTPTMPIAPDFSLQTGDFNQADYERDTATYFEADEDDTRRIDAQGSFHESDFTADAGYQPAYPVEDGAEYSDYEEQAAPEIEAEWSGDVYTPPAADVSNSDSIQREYESAEAAQTADEIEQGYIEPADARLFFEETGSGEQPEWGGAVSTPADAGTFDLDDYEAAESEASEDVYTSPAADVPNSDSIQREYTAPSAEAGYEDEADAYAGEYEAAESEGEWSPDANIYTPPDESYDAPQQNESIDEASAPEGQWGADPDVYTPPPVDLVQRDYQQPADDYDAAQSNENIAEVDIPPEQWHGDVDAATSAEPPNAIEREYESSPVDDANYTADLETYENDDENIAPEWGWDAAPPPADQAPYDEQGPVNPRSADADVSAPADSVQRDYEPPTLPAAPDANYDVGYGDTGDQPVDLYQAMMGAGMVPPDSGWDGGDGGMSPGFVQRTPDADDYAPGQPVDVFQAMMQAGMVQPSPDDNLGDTYYPPDTETSMSETTRADLLSLLDMPAPRGSQASSSDFTPDVSQQSGDQNSVSRTIQPPQAEPPFIQRVAEEPENGQQNDVNVDQLARDVYSVLRNRLRIERERRDRKP